MNGSGFNALGPLTRLQRACKFLQVFEGRTLCAVGIESLDFMLQTVGVESSVNIYL